jgi:hypothetical protein
MTTAKVKHALAGIRYGSGEWSSIEAYSQQLAILNVAAKLMANHRFQALLMPGSK